MTLPPLPEQKDFTEHTPYGPAMTVAAIADYEIALRMYWEARCRLAVEALGNAYHAEYPGEILYDAIAAIGPLPE